MKQTNGRNLKKCDNGSRLSENIFLRKFQVHSTKKEEEKGGRWGRRGKEMWRRSDASRGSIKTKDMFLTHF